LEKRKKEKEKILLLLVSEHSLQNVVGSLFLKMRGQMKIAHIIVLYVIMSSLLVRDYSLFVRDYRERERERERERFCNWRD
jgi:Ni,Fe-hydrogenase I cytochrome b subunit